MKQSTRAIIASLLFIAPHVLANEVNLTFTGRVPRTCGLRAFRSGRSRGKFTLLDGNIIDLLVEQNFEGDSTLTFSEFDNENASLLVNDGQTVNSNGGNIIVEGNKPYQLTANGDVQSTMTLQCK